MINYSQINITTAAAPLTSKQPRGTYIPLKVAMYLINYKTLYEIPTMINPINKHTFASHKVYFRRIEVLSATMHLIE